MLGEIFPNVAIHCSVKVAVVEHSFGKLKLIKSLLYITVNCKEIEGLGQGWYHQVRAHSEKQTLVIQ